MAENVVAAPVMGRRAMYQFGMLLPWSEHHHVDQGLGKGVSTGSSALVPPTIDITETGQELVLDMGYIPARDGMGVPAGFPAREDIALMAFDPAVALENAEANKAKFAELFGAE